MNRCYCLHASHIAAAFWRQKMFTLIQRLRSLFRIGVVRLPAKFGARTAWAGVLGICLSAYDLAVRLPFAGALGLFALFLSLSFFGWDRQPLTATRIGLYGLYVVGEVGGVGTLVFTALGGFTGAPYVWQTLVCCFLGSFLCLVPMLELTKPVKA
ncbi:hypothetical protein HC928_00020 [bacterium]|nr:hypothetical protein [bacterium]